MDRLGRHGAMMLGCLLFTVSYLMMVSMMEDYEEGPSTVPHQVSATSLTLLLVGRLGSGVATGEQANSAPKLIIHQNLEYCHDVPHFSFSYQI